MIPEPTAADLIAPLERERNKWKALAEEYEQDCHRLEHAKQDLERALELEKRAHQELKERQPLLDQLLIDRERLRRERNDERERASIAEQKIFELGKTIQRLEAQGIGAGK